MQTVIFALLEDFAAVLNAMPTTHQHRRTLNILDEALHRDVYFIDCYPTTLFQCMWNLCWWYDAPSAAAHYDDVGNQADSERSHILHSVCARFLRLFRFRLSDSLRHGRRNATQSDLPPWDREGAKLHELLDQWRTQKESITPGFIWLRSLRPPSLHLGTPQQIVLRAENVRNHMVKSVAYSPEGRRLVSSHDDTIRIWDVGTGEEILRIQGESDVESVAWSPDGWRVVTGSNEGLVCVWDVASGAELQRLHGHTRCVNSVTFSSDGRRILSAAEDIRAWDVATGAEIECLSGHGGPVVLSPDGHRILSGGEHIYVWDSNTGNELLRLQCHKRCVNSLACSPNARHIASCEGDYDADCENGDFVIRVSDIRTGKELCRCGKYTSSITSLAYSPDGRHLVGGLGHSALVWDAETGTELRWLHGHEGPVLQVAYSPNGRWIVSAGCDNTIRIWDADNGEGARLLRGQKEYAYFSNIAFSHDGRRVVSSHYDTADRSWRVRVWDAMTGSELRDIQGQEQRVGSVAFSPDGRSVACGRSDGLISVRDAETTNELHRLPSKPFETVTSVAFSADGKRIASTSEDVLGVTVYIWEAETGEEVFRMGGCGITGVAFSPDGRLLVGNRNGEHFCIWDAESGKCLECREGYFDAASIAGSDSPVLRVVAYRATTAIEEAGTGTIVARFPVSMPMIATNTIGRMWAGSSQNLEHLYILALEGDVP